MNTEPLRRPIETYGILLRMCTTGRDCFMPLVTNLQSSSKMEVALNTVAQLTVYYQGCSPKSEDLVALQIEVAVDGAGQHLRGSDQDAEIVINAS